MDWENIYQICDLAASGGAELGKRISFNPTVML